MTRTALIAVALVASAAAAQPVTLRLWNVPAGARICETGTHTVSNRFFEPRGIQKVDLAFSADVCWSGFETRDGRLVGAHEVLTRSESSDDRLDIGPDPLIGDTLQLARQPDESWRARSLHGPPPPTWGVVIGLPFVFDLDDLYVLDTPVSVGDTWEIPVGVLARAAGGILVSLGTPYRYTVRLDSLGERAGRRVAFVTHDGTFTLSGPDETPVSLHKTRVAAIDLETGVETWAAQTLVRTFESEASDERGKPAVARVTMTQRSETERTIEAPPRR